MIIIYIILIIILLILFYNLESFNYNIKLFENKKSRHEGYNLGDIFNLPYYYINEGREQNPHNGSYYEEGFLKSCEDFKGNTILSYYCESRKENLEEKIPNKNRLIQSVDEYISNNLDEIDLIRLISKVSKPNTLCVHIRSGDKGVIEDEFIEIIKKVSNEYDEIIFLCGIHADESWMSFEESKLNLTKSLDKATSTINKKYIIDLSKADYHLVVMRRAKNLLLHRGGFSMIGALIFSGNNLYISNSFYGINNKEFMSLISSEIIYL